jgi:hypothetical protein
MALMPRKLLVQQGTTGNPVKTPAEDWRLGHGGLWTPSSVTLIERGGVVPGPAPSGGTRPVDVSAAAGGVFTIRQGRLRIPGAAALQGSYDGVVDAVTTRTIPGASLPGVGQYKAGHLIARLYDQVYGDAQDGYDFEFVLGAPAASANAAVFPGVTGTNGYLIIRSFTVDSTGAVTFTSYRPPWAVTRGAPLPVATEAEVVALGSTGMYPGAAFWAEDTKATGIWDPAAGRVVWFDSRWQTWTPRFAGGSINAWASLGNGTAIGRYFRTGRKVDVEYQFTIGTTGNFGGVGAIFIECPPGLYPYSWTATISTIPITGTCIVYNTGNRLGTVAMSNDATPANRRLVLYNTDANGLALQSAGSGTAGSWFVWAAGHQFFAAATYETAFEA